MFVRAVKNNKGRNNTYFCSLVESYRENNVPKHRVILNFGLIEADRVPYLKAAFSKDDPAVTLENEIRSQEKRNC